MDFITRLKVGVDDTWRSFPINVNISNDSPSTAFKSPHARKGSYPCTPSWMLHGLHRTQEILNHSLQCSFHQIHLHKAKNRIRTGYFKPLIYAAAPVSNTRQAHNHSTKGRDYSCRYLSVTERKCHKKDGSKVQQ